MLTEPEFTDLTAGARGSARLVLDDFDCLDLLRRLADALKSALVAYCIMDTHLHAVAEAPPEHAARWFDVAMAGYVRAHNARHGTAGDRLRGPVRALPIPGPEELSRAITYQHRNPVNLASPLVAEAIEYEWSSQRAYAGLSCAPFANVEGARRVLGPRIRWPAGDPVRLADLEPRLTPSASPELLLGAAAQTFGFLPEELRSGARGPLIAQARATYVHLGILEGYDHAQLAESIDRTRQRVTQFAAVPALAVGRAIRIARTLVREPALRRRIRVARFAP